MQPLTDQEKMVVIQRYWDNLWVLVGLEEISYQDAKRNLVAFKSHIEFWKPKPPKKDAPPVEIDPDELERKAIKSSVLAMEPVVKQGIENAYKTGYLSREGANDEYEAWVRAANHEPDAFDKENQAMASFKAGLAQIVRDGQMSPKEAIDYFRAYTGRLK